MTICNVCGGKCYPSKAHSDQPCLILDDNGVPETQGFFAEPKIVSCLKCEKCGHSFVIGNETTTPDRIVYKSLPNIF